VIKTLTYTLLMIKKISLLCIGLFFTTHSFSNYSELLQEKTQHYFQNEREYTKINFNQERTLIGFENSLKSKGSLRILSKSDLVYSQESPRVETLKIRDGELILPNTSANSNTTNLKNALYFQKVYALLSAVISGQHLEIEKNYTVQLTKSQNIWKIKLTPKSKDLKSLYKSVWLQGNQKLTNIAVINTDNSSLEINFYGEKTYSKKKI